MSDSSNSSDTSDSDGQMYKFISRTQYRAERTGQRGSTLRMASSASAASTSRLRQKSGRQKPPAKLGPWSGYRLSGVKPSSSNLRRRRNKPSRRASPTIKTIEIEYHPKVDGKFVPFQMINSSIKEFSQLHSGPAAGSCHVPELDRLQTQQWQRFEQYEKLRRGKLGDGTVLEHSREKVIIIKQCITRDVFKYLADKGDKLLGKGQQPGRSRLADLLPLARPSDHLPSLEHPPSLPLIKSLALPLQPVKMVKVSTATAAPGLQGTDARMIDPRQAEQNKRFGIQDGMAGPAADQATARPMASYEGVTDRTIAPEGSQQLVGMQQGNMPETGPVMATAATTTSAPTTTIAAPSGFSMRSGSEREPSERHLSAAESAQPSAAAESAKPAQPPSRDSIASGREPSERHLQEEPIAEHEPPTVAPETSASTAPHTIIYQPTIVIVQNVIDLSAAAADASASQENGGISVNSLLTKLGLGSAGESLIMLQNQEVFIFPNEMGGNVMAPGGLRMDAATLLRLLPPPSSQASNTNHSQPT